jgi:hypothetical protein
MRRFSSFFAVSVLLSACSVDIAHDYGVIVSWLINGAAPSQEQCREHGVERVRFDVSRGDYRTLEGDCGEGVEFDDGTSYGAFVTTESFDFDKNYTYAESMVDADGRVVDGLTTTGSFRVYWDDYLPYLVDPLELFDPDGDVASFEGAWTIGDDTAQGCADLQISEVVLLLTTRTDADFTSAIEVASAACASGRLASSGAVLAQGDYLMKYQARSEGGALVDESQATEAVVDQPGVLTVPTARFDGL